MSRPSYEDGTAILFSELESRVTGVVACICSVLGRALQSNMCKLSPQCRTVLPINPFKLKLETGALQFYNVYAQGYKTVSKFVR